MFYSNSNNNSLFSYNHTSCSSYRNKESTFCERILCKRFLFKIRTLVSYNFHCCSSSLFILCLRIQLSFLNKNFLWSTHIVLAFSEMKGVYNCMTRCERQILLPVLQQNQKSCKSSFLSQWRRITIVLSTEATIPDEDYEENIMMLTGVDQNSRGKVILH